MKFEKKVLFLGRQQMSMSDGTIYYQLQFYDADSGPINVNVQAQNAVSAAFDGLDFGTPMIVCFALRPKDRLYRLAVDHVCG